MKKLTKEDILHGKDHYETLNIDIYGADVVVRPLTDGELSDVLAILGGVPMNGGGTLDTEKLDVTKNFKALRLAASLGLVDPKLTIDEVADMKFGVPELIGTKVLELSGLSSTAETKKKELN
jgi:hypothetical protein